MTDVPASNTTVTTPEGVAVDQYMANMVTNPTLVPGTEFTPVLMGASDQQIQNRGENLTGTGASLATNDQQNYVQQPQTPVTAPQVQQTQAQTTQASTTDPLGYINPTSSTYNPALIGNNAAQGTAEQGVVNPLATVSGQLSQLYAQSADGQVPTWAQGAVRLANDVMAARGLGASTIGATAVQAAVQESAFNIASKDAATYFQMDLANLDNRQQMSLQNLMNRQQSLLSDQAATNASLQFNAASEAQTQQFMSTLVAQIQAQNADRKQAIDQFNAQEANNLGVQNAAASMQAQTFNSQQKQAIEEFNATLRHQREQFNAQTQFAIEQSNVLWRRSLNTANTAAVNAANQLNVQNKFNLSSTALNNIWQQMRDEASWAFQASENDKTRQFNAANSANNRQFVLNGNQKSFAETAGAFAVSLLLG